MFGSVIANGVNAAIDTTDFAKTEAFASETGVGNTPARVALVSVITVFILLVIILFAGKYLWNNVLVADLRAGCANYAYVARWMQLRLKA